MKNIILIGMPGTGKSVVGQALAARLGYTFIDVDDLIVAASKTNGTAIRRSRFSLAKRLFRQAKTLACKSQRFCV